MSFTKLNKGWALAGTLTFGLALWGCEEALDLTGLDGSGDPINFSREMTLGELQDALTGGAARVELELIGDGLVARRVALTQSEAKHEEEEIESRVTGVEVIGNDGILTLMLGELRVTFDPETYFRVGDDEMGFEAFVDRVQGILAEGHEPWVKAWRPAPEQPQAPDVSSFHARGIKVMEDGEEPEIEINIDVDNLAVNGDRQDGEPDGWINVLGLAVELRVSDGVTELVNKDADISDKVEFEGHVFSVDVTAGTFTFTDGTVVQVVDATEILETGKDVELLSLEAVHAALEEGLDVVTWGCGELESVEPRSIVAIKLWFAIHGDGGDDGKDYVEFEGFVTSVNLTGQSFTLTNGTIVKITEHTEIVAAGEGESLMSLEAVDATLQAGHQVIAWGAAEVESTEPLTLVACEMRFVLKDSGSSAEEFEGLVESVHEGEGIVILTDGTVVQLTDDTQIKQAEQGEPLMSLAAVQEALDQGHGVVAWGLGEVESTEPLTLVAIKVYFVIAT